MVGDVDGVSIVSNKMSLQVLVSLKTVLDDVHERG
jgi:hypothetical protein